MGGGDIWEVALVNDTTADSGALGDSRIPPLASPLHFIGEAVEAWERGLVLLATEEQPAGSEGLRPQRGQEEPAQSPEEV